MVHQGKEFGVDLYELEKIAKVDFPATSAVTALLKETRVNLDDTAVALNRAARHYADTDHAARDELYRRAQNDPELGGRL